MVVFFGDDRVAADPPPPQEVDSLCGGGTVVAFVDVARFACGDDLFAIGLAVVGAGPPFFF